MQRLNEEKLPGEKRADISLKEQYGEWHEEKKTIMASKQGLRMPRPFVFNFVGTTN